MARAKKGETTTEVTDKKFRLRKTNAELNHWNTGTEKHNDELKFRSDLKFRVSVPGTVMNDLSQQGLPWLELLWDKDGNARDCGVSKFEFDDNYLGHKITVFVGDKEEFEFDDISVRRIVAVPRAGKRVELTFQAQVHPDDKALAPIRRALVRDKKISVKIEPLRSASAIREVETSPQLSLEEPAE